MINYGCPYAFFNVEIVKGGLNAKTGFTAPGGPFFCSPTAQGHWTGLTMLSLTQQTTGVAKMWGYSESGAFLESSGWVRYDAEWNYPFTNSIIKVVKIGFETPNAEMSTTMTGFILRYVC